MNISSQRKLAAILFADIVAYTAIMEQNEAEGLAMVRRFKEVMNHFVPIFQGEVIQFYGDGCLCIFDSAVDAVALAERIQREFEFGKSIPLRIGIEMGEVVLNGENVYGSGVNIASRVESMGVAGTILFTQNIRDRLLSSPQFKLQTLGDFHFKNVKEPMEVFALANEGLPIPNRSELRGKFKEKEQGKFSNKQKLLASFGAITLIIVAFFASLLFQGQDDNVALSSSIEKTKSIAVLPFINAGDNIELEFFSDGIMEEILTQIQVFGDLRVISRTSVMQYKNTNKPVREIGEELKVGFVLEGSVRRLGGKMMIYVSLVDTEDEGQIWSQRYPGEVNTKDIFEIQNKIASRIAFSLKAQISPQEKALMREVPTQDQRAYDYYLRGNYYFHKQVFYSAENTYKALEMYEKALAFDPNFAMVHVRMAACNRFLYWFNFDESEERKELAKQHLDRALAIQPKLPQAKVEQAWALYHFDRNYEKAIPIFKEGIKLLPNDFEAYSGLANCLKRFGKFEEAHIYSKKVIELAPNGVFELLDMAQICEHKGSFAEAQTYYEKLIDISPTEGVGYAGLARLMIRWKWDLETADKLLQKPIENEDQLHRLYRFKVAEGLGKFDEAASILEKIEGDIAFRGQSDYLPVSLLQASLYQQKKDISLSKEYAQKAIHILEERLVENPKDHLAFISLGKAHAFAGNAEQAIAHAQKAMELMPVSKGAILGADFEKHFADIYVLLGQYDKAIEKLSYIFTLNKKFAPAYFLKGPFYQNLHPFPEFQSLMKGKE